MHFYIRRHLSFCLPAIARIPDETLYVRLRCLFPSAMIPATNANPPSAAPTVGLQLSGQYTQTAYTIAPQIALPTIPNASLIASHLLVRPLPGGDFRITTLARSTIDDW